MNLRKWSVALLALLLAAMAMIPMVSAGEQVVSASPVGHQIPTDYLKDSKPAQWLPESDMVNIVISQRSLEKFGQGKLTGIITIPVSYIDLKTTFTNSKENPYVYTENSIGSDEGIALIRMPGQMYEMYVLAAKDGKLSLPADYFVRYYENRTDLNNHFKADGNSVQVLPSEKYPLPKISSGVGTDVSPEILPVQKPSGISVSPAVTYPQFFGFWENYNRISSTNYDYCIGQITPNSWTLSGSALDQFDIFQEREYKFNSGEAIEVVTKYRDRNQGGDIVLFPTLYRSGSTDPITPSQWTVWGDYLPVATNSIPHAFGYHVYFSGGYYYIAFEDMNTLQFVKSYQATAASGTSSFTYLSGSSEYRQKAAPTTNTFSATTNPVVDQWVRVLNGAWQAPNLAWQHVTRGSGVSYVDVQTQVDSSGNIITRSSGHYP
ncbi:hypothetical protein [Methanoregula sp.]|uniref:hypothetical protein n=1 Tax=Methanoregula sp. TaxID=2052170 RepID=UPI003C77CBD8